MATFVAVVLAGCSSGAGAGGGSSGAASTVTSTTATSTTATSTTGSVPLAPTTAASTTTTTTATTTSTAVATTAAPATTAPGPAGTPEELAARLVAAERTIRDPAADEAAVARAGREQQLVYRWINAHRDSLGAMRAVVPDDVQSAFDLNVKARAPIAGAPAPPPPPATIPAWTIREPRPAVELLGYYHEAERATGVPWYYLAAINLAESAMGRIEGSSSAGAMGPMQFLPSTWAACCTGDINDDEDAILGAATYLARSGAPERMDDAILQYNPSQGYLQAVTSYAEVMRLDERAYAGYHAWDVFVATSAGPVRLGVGFSATEPIDAAAYLAAHPDDRG